MALAELSWTGLGAADSPPCDPGWAQVTDDSGQQTCVQPSSAPPGTCDPGQAPYLDSQGDKVCYATGLTTVSKAASSKTAASPQASGGWSEVVAFLKTPAGIAAAVAVLFLMKKKW
jgi:hypothetical protein